VERCGQLLHSRAENCTSRKQSGNPVTQLRRYPNRCRTIGYCHGYGFMDNRIECRHKIETGPSTALLYRTKTGTFRFHDVCDLYRYLFSIYRRPHAPIPCLTSSGPQNIQAAFEGSKIEIRSHDDFYHYVSTHTVPMRGMAAKAANALRHDPGWGFFCQILRLCGDVKAN
jgi:hypothetical protein